MARFRHVHVPGSELRQATRQLANRRKRRSHQQQVLRPGRREPTPTHGKIVGDYADLIIGGLESGNRFFGTVDLWAITPPCWMLGPLRSKQTTSRRQRRSGVAHRRCRQAHNRNTETPHPSWPHVGRRAVSSRFRELQEAHGPPRRASARTRLDMGLRRRLAPRLTVALEGSRCRGNRNVGTTQRRARDAAA